MREGRNIDIVMLYQTSGLNWMFFARRKTTNKSFTCFFSPFIAPRVQPRPIITPRPAPKPKQVRTLDTLRLPTDSGGHSSQERMPQVCSSRSTHILILMVLPFRVRLAKWLINHLAAISEANRFVSRLGLRKAFRE